MSSISRRDLKRAAYEAKLADQATAHLAAEFDSTREVVHQADATGRACAWCGEVICGEGAPAWRPWWSVVVVGGDPAASWHALRRPNCAMARDEFARRKAERIDREEAYRARVGEFHNSWHVGGQQ